MKKLYTILTLVCAVVMASATPTPERLSKRQHTDAERDQVYFEMARKAMEAHKKAPAFKLGKNQPEKADASQYVEIFEQTFAGLKEGTNEEPAPEPLGNWISPLLMNGQDGWWGAGMYQAGGALALAAPDFGGYVSTPAMYLGGDIKIKFRMKAMEGNDDYPAIVFLSVLGADVYNPQSLCDYKTILITTSEGWQEFEYDFHIDYTGDDAFVQFNAGTYNQGVLLDDVEILQVPGFVGAPVAKQASAFTYDGFTANWGPVPGVDGYLLDAWYIAQTGNESETFDFDFNEGKLPTETENVDCSIVNKGVDDSACLQLDDEGAEFILPSNGGFVENFVFKYKFAITSPEAMDTSGGTVMVYGLSNKGWEQLSTTYFSDPEQVDVWDEINFKELEDWYNENFPGWFVFSNTYTQVKIVLSWAVGGCTVLVDDVEYQLAPAMSKIYAAQNKKVSDTHFTLTGLNSEAEYTYNVRSYKGNEISPESKIIEAFGVAQPKLLPATEIDEEDGGYTANWEAAPKAESYQASSFHRSIIKESEEDYIILNEDFTNVDLPGVTPEEPKVIGSPYEVESLDSYTKNVGWHGRNNVLADGMIGIGSDASMLGVLETPGLDLSHNNGVYNVYIRLYCYEGESIVVQGNTQFRMLTIPYTGLTEGWVTMTDGDINTHINFYTSNGLPFLLDEVMVTQDVKAGDTLYTLADESGWMDSDVLDYHFSEVAWPEKTDDYEIYFSVQSRILRDYTYYNSDMKNTKLVPYSDDEPGMEVKDPEIEEELGNPAAPKITLTWSDFKAVELGENVSCTLVADSRAEGIELEAKVVEGAEVATVELIPDAVVPEGKYTLTITEGSFVLVAEDGKKYDSKAVASPITVAAGVDQLMGDGTESADVYNAAGMLILRNATHEQLSALEDGLYIINGKKIIIR